MEYTVVEAKDLETLLEEVNRHMKVDWECQGGIAVVKNTWDRVVYHQALVRKTIATDKV